MFCPWSRICRPWELKMDSVQISLLVLGLVLVLSVQTGHGEDMQCHVCNSAEEYDGEACDDPFVSDTYIRNCSTFGEDYKYCRKMRQNVDGEVRIIRQCATHGRIGQCVDRTGTKAIKITYCECEGSKCNGANPVFSMSMLLLTISSALLALIYHL